MLERRKFKGVHPTADGKFVAKISINGINTTIGTFPCDHEAARAYDAKAMEVGGSRALNFPPKKRGKPPGKRPQTGFLGVTKKWKGFQATLSVEGKAKYIGTFPTIIAAAHAYDTKAKEVFGDRARLNFPDGT